MMIHGFDRTLLHQDLLGVARVTFEWEGRASHASVDPWEGRNALDACVATFNGVAMLRQQMRPDCRIHGVVAEGGIAGNIIPERAVADFNVRGPSLEAMWALHQRVVACAEAAAVATATRLTVTRHSDVYEPLRRNQGLLDVFAANLAASRARRRARGARPPRLLGHRQREPGDADHPCVGRRSPPSAPRSTPASSRRPRWRRPRGRGSSPGPSSWP